MSRCNDTPRGPPSSHEQHHQYLPFCLILWHSVGLPLGSHDNVEVKLKTPWSNGTTHLIFTHSEFIEKLIALIPPPWFHMVRYFGIFVSNAKFRETVLPGFDGKKKMPKQPKKKRSIKWADLLKRVFDVDVTKCQKCGGLLKLIDILMPSPELTQLLRQLNLNPDPPPRLPAKTSHLFDAFFEDEVFCE